MDFKEFSDLTKCSLNLISKIFIETNINYYRVHSPSTLEEPWLANYLLDIAESKNIVCLTQKSEDLFDSSLYYWIIDIDRFNSLDNLISTVKKYKKIQLFI